MTDDASRTPHHTIQSLEINAGFLSGSRLDFTDGLNAIIGCPGTGKSTVLELLRFAIGTPVPEERRQHVDSLLKRSAPGATVSARILTQHGVGYTSTRARGEEPRVVNEKGAYVEVSLSSDVFRAGHYSQRSDTIVVVSVMDKVSDEQGSPVHVVHSVR